MYLLLVWDFKWLYMDYLVSYYYLFLSFELSVWPLITHWFWLKLGIYFHYGSGIGKVSKSGMVRSYLFIYLFILHALESLLVVPIKLMGAQ